MTEVSASVHLLLNEAMALFVLVVDILGSVGIVNGQRFFQVPILAQYFNKKTPAKSLRLITSLKEAKTHR